jgi:hypothetical protein
MKMPYDSVAQRRFMKKPKKPKKGTKKPKPKMPKGGY